MTPHLWDFVRHLQFGQEDYVCVRCGVRGRCGSGTPPEGARMLSSNEENLDGSDREVERDCDLSLVGRVLEE